MATVKLSSGFFMPRIGFGTYLLKEETKCKEIVADALKVGYRLIDTATVYQNEQYIGEVLSNEELFKALNIGREDIFITTKVGPADQGRGTAREAVLTSLEKLKCQYLDLVLIHWPGSAGLDPSSSEHAERRKKSWLQLEELVQEGKVRSIGVSNYTIRHLKELQEFCTVRPAVNQVEFHPLLYQKELLEYCRANEIVLQAYSSLGAAKGFDILSNVPKLRKMADVKGRRVPQVLLKWALCHGVPIIPKTSDTYRLRENFRADEVELSDEEVAELDALNANQHFCWDPNTIA